MADLQGQIDRVELVGRGVAPLMLNMIDAIEKFVELDTPFLVEERNERVAGLHELMGRADVTDSEKYRRIMEAYQIENEFGRTIEAYRGTIDRGGRKAGAWSQAKRDWTELDSSYRAAIKQGLRVARKQAAPDMIRLPIPAAENAGGSI